MSSDIIISPKQKRDFLRSVVEQVNPTQPQQFLEILNIVFDSYVPPQSSISTPLDNAIPSTDYIPRVKIPKGTILYHGTILPWSKIQPQSFFSPVLTLACSFVNPFLAIVRCKKDLHLLDLTTITDNPVHGRKFWKNIYGKKLRETDIIEKVTPVDEKDSNQLFPSLSSLSASIGLDGWYALSEGDELSYNPGELSVVTDGNRFYAPEIVLNDIQTTIDIITYISAKDLCTYDADDNLYIPKFNYIISIFNCTNDLNLDQYELDQIKNIVAHKFPTIQEEKIATDVCLLIVPPIIWIDVNIFLSNSTDAVVYYVDSLFRYSKIGQGNTNQNTYADIIIYKLFYTIQIFSISFINNLNENVCNAILASFIRFFIYQYQNITEIPRGTSYNGQIFPSELRDENMYTYHDDRIYQHLNPNNNPVDNIILGYYLSTSKTITYQQQIQLQEIIQYINNNELYNPDYMTFIPQWLRKSKAIQFVTSLS